MAHRSELIASDIEGYLAQHQYKDLLRVLTCGSVDDGKSTLIGRLLHDADLVYEDHLAALIADSAVHGTTGDNLDLALLTDGLKAEREQGITIDVAYRYFSTARRKFIVADAPGHVQYTRNMVTGASNSQLSVILVDARHGVLDQTRRHAYIAALLGIRHVVIAVNKIDLVGYSRDRFDEIRSECERFEAHLGLAQPYVLPIAAVTGDNVVRPSTHTPWFDGPPLLEYLETVDVRGDLARDHLRFPVQLVLRPDLDFRGYAGTVASGWVSVGQRVVAVPSGLETSVERIVTFDGDLEEAGPGRSVTITLSDDIDLARGDLLVAPGELPQRAHDLEVTLVWMAEEPAVPGQQLLLRSINRLSNVSLRAIHHRIDVRSLEDQAAASLELNDIARCQLSVDRELQFDPYTGNPATGSFILVDRLSNATVAAGMIAGPASRWDLEPAGTLARQPSTITAEERAARLRQRPCTVVLTGMTGAGKSTIATALERRLFDRRHSALRLDGEDLRIGISRDLGFADEDRSENLRRAAEIAQLANQQGLIAIVAVQAPAASVRDRIRDLVGGDRYVEVYLDAPEHVRRARDPHDLYRLADEGELDHLPGATTEYQVPENPDLRLDTAPENIEESVDSIVALLIERRYLPED